MLQKHYSKAKTSQDNWNISYNSFSAISTCRHFWKNFTLIESSCYDLLYAYFQGDYADLNECTSDFDWGP